jgi:hypothetical protein
VNVKNNGGTTTGATWNFTVQSAVTLAQPTNFSATSSTSNSISLSWTDTSTGESSYLIERKTGAGGTYAQIASIAANSTGWTDNATNDPSSPPQPVTTYYYRVRSYDGSATFGPYSAESSTTTYAATPANVTASAGTFYDKVHLSWDAAGGAVSYQLYRSTTNDVNTALLLAPSSTNSFDDTGATAGTTYYYWVASKDSLNRLSAKSASASGFRAVDNIPPSVNNDSFGYASSDEPVVFAFSENVSASLDTGDLTVTNLADNSTVTPGGVSYDGATNTASFSMPSLPDGNYRAVLHGSGVTDQAGNPMSGDVTVDFFVLGGDANRDRTVDLTDFTVLASNFNGTGKSWNTADFNYDGVVDLTDFTILASRFNSTLAPPAAPAASPFSVTAIRSPQDPIDALVPN